MQIHEMNQFIGTPGDGDYLAIDDGNETRKIESSKIGVNTPMTIEEGKAGIVTNPRVIAPNILKQILQALYPVGSIYMSTSSTNPKTFIGGTWEQIQGRFLVGAGSNNASGAEALNLSAGTTGGEKDHTLTINEMPTHDHPINANYYQRASGNLDTYGYVSKTSGTNTGYSANTGGGQSHNNLPPYLAVYIWKRTS